MFIAAQTLDMLLTEPQATILMARIGIRDGFAPRRNRHRQSRAMDEAQRATPGIQAKRVRQICKRYQKHH